MIYSEFAYDDSHFKQQNYFPVFAGNLFFKISILSFNLHTMNQAE